MHRPAVLFPQLMNMMLLAGLLLAIGFALLVWVFRTLGRRHRRQDLGAVSTQWLMSNRIER